MLSGRPQTGLDMYWLKQEDTPGTQDLSPSRRSELLMVAFVTLVPALCRSFIRSLRVVPGLLLTVLMMILTPRDEILRGAPDGGRLSIVWYVFHFFYNCSHSFYSHQPACLL
ncbi:hypothetical protein ILYODFUR_019234 [Ilyodon furcidens]|uniref:Uncharacterized protein n=1 Tax=Ilyodon furcidens TaxID=33524 RepID=A0ABV0V5Z3_9TELE